MKRALIAGIVYALALFALGFMLGTVRLMFVAPRFGELAATLLELPVMLTAAFFACRYVIGRWQVGGPKANRTAMALSFLALLLSLEMLLGVTLVGRTVAEQWATLTTPAGLLGLTAQIIAALFAFVIDSDASP